MSGRIVKKGHHIGWAQCRLPGHLRSREVGTVWECKCGRRWIRNGAGIWRRTFWSWFRPLDPCPTWPGEDEAHR